MEKSWWCITALLRTSWSCARSLAGGNSLQFGYRHRDDRPPGGTLHGGWILAWSKPLAGPGAPERRARHCRHVSSDEPDKMVAARIGNAGGVVIGIGEGEMFVPLICLPSWTIPAGLSSWNHDRWQWSPARGAGETVEGEPVSYEVHSISWDPVSAEKGEYRHFMHKGNPRAGTLFDRYHLRSGGFRRRAHPSATS
jgi:hypothetical protein